MATDIAEQERNTLFAADALRYAHHEAVPWEVAGIVLSMTPEGAKVLDVGCGTGALASLLIVHKDCDVTGVEPDPDRASVARQVGVNVHVGLFDDSIAELDNDFDVVLFADVLEHLEDPLSTLRSGLSGW